VLCASARAFNHQAKSFRDYNIDEYCHDFRGVTIDGVWIGYWIY
jgi:hypothetical protein